MAEIWQLGAGELASAIGARKISAVEAVDAHLARIEAVNPSVNAIVRVLDVEARAQAMRADDQVKAGDQLGPLHGVPFTVKENIDMAGLPTTWGVSALAEAVVPIDAPVVERMKAAGAIAIGRTNLPDFALRLHTDSTLHGLTRNPWNLGRTAGGSSGGEAVALATGMTPIGLGNDIGGSLRNPANACGIASIRPSAGRVPDAGFVPSLDRLLAEQLMNVQGSMARSIADVRLGLQVLMGAHPRDPLSINQFWPDQPHAPCKVALVAEPPGGTTNPKIAAVVRKAAAALADAGYQVEEICPPNYEDAIAAWQQMILWDFGTILEQIAPLMGADAVAFLMATNQSTPPMDSMSALSQLFVRRYSIARAWSQFLAERPLILSPTWTDLPFAHGFDCQTADGAVATVAMARPVVPANLLGLPSACVPAGQDSETNLPIGVLVTGGRSDDARCLDAAAIIEQRLGLITPIDPRL
jgi:amidase